MSTQTVRLHRWDEIALEKVTEMLSRKLVTGEREMLAQIYLKRGCLVPNHSHESEQITYVLQGALKFLIGGDEITVREGEVLQLMAEGKTNSAIASALHISVGSAEKHIASIFTKLDLAPDESENRRVLAVLRYLES